MDEGWRRRKQEEWSQIEDVRMRHDCLTVCEEGLDVVLIMNCVGLPT